MAYDPHPLIPCPGFVAQEGVCGNALHPKGLNGCRDLFSVSAPLRRCHQVGVEVPGHHRRRPAGALADVCDNAFYGNRIVRGQIILNNETWLSS